MFDTHEHVAHYLFGGIIVYMLMWNVDIKHNVLLTFSMSEGCTTNVAKINKIFKIHPDKVCDLQDCSQNGDLKCTLAPWMHYEVSAYSLQVIRRL